MGVVFGRRWHPPELNLELMNWLTGNTLTAAEPLPETRRFRISDGVAAVVRSTIMVAKAPGLLAIVSADHTMVRVNGQIAAVAANKPVVLLVDGSTATVSIRRGGCQLPVIPVSGLGAYLDSTVATIVHYRQAASFPGFVEALPVVRGHWICPGCRCQLHYLVDMWKHIKARGAAPTTMLRLMEAPPSFGAPMSFYAENTVATSSALNTQLHHRLAAESSMVYSRP